ncbi:MAG: methionine adenosyltransferase [Chloroflexota bacterium]|nr:methionine adenosyltransferase [Chloroflexota bacterium]|tara:strand:+ start:3718 stop:4884 length:1167 start_codon:yes stop_codon:yes gene_type:complete
MDTYLLTSESVTEGHPDKLCDQVSDAILDEIMRLDPNARVACETATTTNLVVLLGEITTSAKIDFEKIARETILSIGYDNNDIGLDGKKCKVITALGQQSPDIKAGVDVALESRSEGSNRLGAGDQGMMIGYATNESKDYMPLPISISHALTRKLSEVRKNGTLEWVRPDGKSQITMEYKSDGTPLRIDTVVISTQHSPDVTQELIKNDLEEYVCKETIPSELIDNKTRFIFNPSGQFIVGGPHGDAGLTGRKIIVDTYGGSCRHGGGAFSGKDCTKVDRTGAYAARWVAKNCVAAGLAERMEVQLSYAIGMSEPISILVDAHGTNKISIDKIIDKIRDNFDLSPGGIIDALNLRRPIYRQTAAYGHFGRIDLDLPWENLNKVNDLSI